MATYRARAAVYVFRDAACMEFGFTQFFHYFQTLEEAKDYAKGFKFCKVVSFESEAA